MSRAETGLLRVVRAPRAVEMRAPSKERIDSVRDLAARFPAARLRPCTVLRAPELDARAGGGARVWLALESMQITGSFKVRGALVASDEQRRRGVDRVVAVSAGNHGAGLAYACNVVGMRATVCVPRTAPRAKTAKMRAWGAELHVVESDSYDDAEAFAKDLAVRERVPFLSPYDDEDIVLGNGTSLGHEVVAALGKIPEIVIAPFGGGGFASGLAWAFGRKNVWGVESEASPSISLSLDDNAARVRCDATMPTVAEGLEGGISESGFERARRAIAGVLVVTERAIHEAMAYAVRDVGVVVEGSAAAALVPALAGLPDGMHGDVVIALTGRNIDHERLGRVLASC